MNAKIPPDVVLLSCGILMRLIAAFAPWCSFTLPYHHVLFWAMLMMGFILVWLGVATIYKHRTTVRPDSASLPKAAALVTTGIYRYTRNPIYLGMAILLLAWVIFLTNWLAVSGVAIFIGFITKYQIIPEESALEKIFGQHYTRYKSAVRRWV